MFVVNIFTHDIDIFRLETKIILRISGYPKLNIFRKFFWSFASKKIFKVTCPSQELVEKLKILNLFSSNKLFFTRCNN